jgi:large subunit ribosomal protein L18
LGRIYAQLVDDNKQSTLAAASSLSSELKKSLKGKETKLEVSKLVGLLLAQQAAEQGIKRVVFDRGSYLYHGRVKALAQGAREGGLEF